MAWATGRRVSGEKLMITPEHWLQSSRMRLRAAGIKKQEERKVWVCRSIVKALMPAG